MKRVACICLFFTFLLAPCLCFAQDYGPLLCKRVTLKTRGLTLFDALDRISQQSGVMFIFDSHDVNGKRRLRGKHFDNSSIGDVLGQIMDDASYTFKEIGSHVLIQRPLADNLADKKAMGLGQLELRGRVMDRQSKHPVAYATIAISDWGMGTTTNAEGYFSIKFDTVYRASNIYISHLGYLPISVPAEALKNGTNDFFLEPHIVSIQEVIIRKVDAREIVKRAVENKDSYYPNFNSRIVSFYREGANHGDKNLYYAESVFKIYKTSYNLGSNHDQVVALKSRVMRNSADSLIFKLKAGVRGILDLDIMKNLPDFLSGSTMDSYVYWKNDIVAMDTVSAYAIGFEQRHDILYPLYSGTIYINSDNGALVGADFEINPRYIEKSASMFVTRPVREFRVVPQSITYSVRYKIWQGRYFISHIRGDLRFDVRRKRRLFSSSYSVFLELTSLKPEVGNVERFSRQQVISPATVFYDSNFSYDVDFWENFNYIKPEDKLLRSISSY